MLTQLELYLKKTVKKIGWNSRKALHYWKASLNKCVFKWVLNNDRVGLFLRLSGKEFHTEGARKLRGLSPAFFKLNFGILRSFWLDELREREVSYVDKEAER